MPGRDEIQIRSFRVVFQLDRRLHRIDRWRLPLPYGLPLRSLGYAAAGLLAVLVVSAVPVFGSVLETLPAPVSLALLPGAIAYGLTSVQIDGRPAHDAFAALLLWRLRPRTVNAYARHGGLGQIARLHDVDFAPDCRGPRLRSGAVRGPASALVRAPAAARQRRRRLWLEPKDLATLDNGFAVEFGAEQRLVIL